MLAILLTLLVLNKGTSSKLLQAENMADILVITLLVLNKGTVRKLKQLLNMLDIFVTPLVSNSGTDCRL